MKTILDDCKTLFFDELIYKDSLQIMVLEGIVAEESQSISIGDMILDDVKAVDTTEKSRRFKVEFDYDALINFQVVDEAYTALDKNESWDTEGFLRIVTHTQYMGYVEANHGWYKDVHGELAKLYRVWTEGEVIEVVSLKEPQIESMP